MQVSCAMGTLIAIPSCITSYHKVKLCKCMGWDSFQRISSKGPRRLSLDVIFSWSVTKHRTTVQRRTESAIEFLAWAMVPEQSLFKELRLTFHKQPADPGPHLWILNRWRYKRLGTQYQSLQPFVHPVIHSFIHSAGQSSGPHSCPHMHISLEKPSTNGALPNER